MVLLSAHQLCEYESDTLSHIITNSLSKVCIPYPSSVYVRNWNLRLSRPLKAPCNNHLEKVLSRDHLCTHAVTTIIFMPRLCKLKMHGKLLRALQQGQLHSHWLQWYENKVVASWAKFTFTQIGWEILLKFLSSSPSYSSAFVGIVNLYLECLPSWSNFTGLSNSTPLNIAGAFIINNSSYSSVLKMQTHGQTSETIAIICHKNIG